MGRDGSESFWAPVVNGTGPHRQFFCSRCDGMGRDNSRLNETGTGREDGSFFVDEDGTGIEYGSDLSDGMGWDYHVL